MHLALKGGVALAMLSLGMTSSHASTVVDCVSVGTATFSPRLTSAFQTGQITQHYNYTCAIVNSNGSSGTSSGTYTFVYDYSGSCVTATISNSGSTGVLVGGLAATVTSTTTSGAGIAAMSFTPLDSLGNPCDMGTAVLVAEGPAIFL